MAEAHTASVAFASGNSKDTASTLSAFETLCISTQQARTEWYPEAEPQGILEKVAVCFPALRYRKAHWEGKMDHRLTHSVFHTLACC